MWACYGFCQERAAITRTGSKLTRAGMRRWQFAHGMLPFTQTLIVREYTSSFYLVRLEWLATHIHLPS